MCLKRIRFNPTQISANLTKLESDFIAKGGKWREFKIGDLFSVKSNPQLNKGSFTFRENGQYPYFTRTVLNNGIAGYVDYLDEKHKIKGGGLAVGMLGMQFFYMEKDFYAGQFTKTCYPKFENFNKQIAYFFIAWLNKNQKVFQGVLVRDFEKVFNNTKIKLPTDKDGQIAFDFMESFIKELEAEKIKELEAEKIKELEAYLKATGLNNYELTNKEKQTLDIFSKSTQPLEWREFKIGDLFSINSSNQILHANKIKNIYDLEQQNTYPYVVRSAVNNGIKGYISEDEKYLNPANTLSFAQDTFVVFYQEKPYFTGNNVKVLIPKFKNFNKIIALFIIASFQKVLADLSWGQSLTKNSIENFTIKLPTKDNMPDFDFTESFTSAVQKEVELEKIKELEAYLKATGLNNYELTNKEKQTLDIFSKSTQPLEWREFRIGDLFESKNGDFDIQKTHLNNKGHLVVSSGIDNCGIIGKTDIKAKIFPCHTLTCDMFGNVFYRGFEYKMVTHARVFSLKFLDKNFNSKSAFFVATAMKLLKSKFSYSNMCSFKKIQDMTILLPTQKGKIAFNFMESFIKEIEQEILKELELEKIKGLDAYLKVAGLNTYELSDNEKQTLDIFSKSTQPLEWREFRIGDLFEIFGSKTTPKQELEKYGSGEYPYITTQAVCNGVAGYYNKWTEKGQCLTIDSAVLGTCFYQSENFSASDHVEILRPKFAINRKIGLFFSAIINKTGNILGYSYSKKRSQMALKQESILLPVNKDNMPDFDFMESFISAVQKEVIKKIC